MAPRARGFTLLEVLVAVAVLGLVYVTVARVAIQGMQSEGDASRRLEASLLADRALAELETQLATGVAPPLGEETREEAAYRVAVAVEPFAAEAVGLGAALAEARPPVGGEAGREGRSARGAAPELRLLEPPGRGERPALLRIHVRVAWQDGTRERSVTRSTFALDREVAASRMAEVEGAGEEAGEGEGRRAGARGRRSGRAREGSAPDAGAAFQRAPGGRRR